MPRVAMPSVDLAWKPTDHVTVLRAAPRSLATTPFWLPLVARLSAGEPHGILLDCAGSTRWPVFGRDRLGALLRSHRAHVRVALVRAPLGGATLARVWSWLHDVPVRAFTAADEALRWLAEPTAAELPA